MVDVNGSISWCYFIYIYIFSAPSLLIYLSIIIFYHLLFCLICKFSTLSSLLNIEIRGPWKKVWLIKWLRIILKNHQEKKERKKFMCFGWKINKYFETIHHNCNNLLYYNLRIIQLNVNITNHHLNWLHQTKQSNMT